MSGKRKISNSEVNAAKRLKQAHIKDSESAKAGFQIEFQRLFWLSASSNKNQFEIHVSYQKMPV